MIISAHFTEIQLNIIQNLKKAKFDIFVAVAWITDKSMWQILEEKAKSGVVVQVILVPDEINNNNETYYKNFAKSGGHLAWDNHHHKFCVIDREIVITGSYNWTIMANNREKRENILIIEQNAEIIDQFSNEFRMLLKKSHKYEHPKEVIYVEKEVQKIIYVEKIVEQTIENIKVIEKPIIVQRSIPLLSKTLNEKNKWYKNLQKDLKIVLAKNLQWSTLKNSLNHEEFNQIFSMTTLDFKGCQNLDIRQIYALGALETLIVNWEIEGHTLMEIQKFLPSLNIIYNH
jgi:phosphatidylserine/phosphatidylglycerophosphate/cardiolipin synthase-like enzyme